MFAQVQIWFALFFAFIGRHKTALTIALVLALVVAAFALPDMLVEAGPATGNSHCPGC
jgi:hypothetical protein